MLVELLKDCRNDEEKAQRKAEFVAAEPALKVLRNIFKQRLDQAVNDMSRNQNYDSPSWAYVQADRVAQMRVYKDLLALLTLTKE